MHKNINRLLNFINRFQIQICLRSNNQQKLNIFSYGILFIYKVRICEHPLFYQQQNIKIMNTHPIWNIQKTIPLKNNNTLTEMIQKQQSAKQQIIVIYRKVLMAIRKYILMQFVKKLKNFLFIEKIGILTIQENRKCKIKPDKQFTSKFTMKKSVTIPRNLLNDQQIEQQKWVIFKSSNKFNSEQNKENIISDDQGSDIYSKIGGKMQIPRDIIQTVFNNYVSAALQIANNDTQRLVQIDLGVFIIQIQHRIVTIKDNLPTKINNNRTNQQILLDSSLSIINKIKQSKFSQNNQMKQKYERRWNQSIIGCLNEELHLRNISDNLDKGHKLTMEYLKHQRDINKIAEQNKQ